MTNIDRQSAFTLVEMVTVIVLLGILSGVTAPIFSQGLTAGRLTSESLDSMAKIRYCLERLTREMRQINHNGGGYDISILYPDHMVFVKNDLASTPVVIQKVGSELKFGYTSTVSGSTSALTDEVSSLIFKYLDVNGTAGATSANIAFVEITLSLTNPETSAVYTQRSRVALRDKS